jgi:hypothetical protein
MNGNVQSRHMYRLRLGKHSKITSEEGTARQSHGANITEQT